MENEQFELLHLIEGKEVDCVQPIVQARGTLFGFTIRFKDGTLLAVDAGTCYDSGILEIELKQGPIEKGKK